MSKHPWYHTTRWRKLREAQLKAYPLCAMCEKSGRDTIATVADHVVPHRGDSELFWHGKLQSLCSTCHGAAKAMQERHGYSQACDVNGFPVDRGHPWEKNE